MQPRPKSRGGLWTEPQGFIYVLIDPRDGRIRYVGLTTDWTVRRNLHTTCTPQRSSGARYRAWRAELAAESLRPEMECVEAIAKFGHADDLRHILRVREAAWHEALTRAGYDLVNDPKHVQAPR